MAERLPPELWSYIFDLAADEDTIFYPGLQTSMAHSTWSKNPFGGWAVRTPQDTISIIQRRSYATKKVPSHLASLPRYRSMLISFSYSRSSQRAGRGAGSAPSFSSAVSSLTIPPNCAISPASWMTTLRWDGGQDVYMSPNFFMDAVRRWTTLRNRSSLSSGSVQTLKFSSSICPCQVRSDLSQTRSACPAVTCARHTGTYHPSSFPK